ncbi:sensor histidine kinase [Pedobacter sp. MW01-1-1]|uniref:sensor histidine kinase n=1 Tax=Pedobacter sp. MW01-1-1 TaxID=3383027 RepID=UPI003FEE67DC
MQKQPLKSWFYPILPVLLWSAFTLLPFLLQQNEPHNPMHRNFMWNQFARNLLILVVFFVHSYVLYPILKKRKWLIYGALLCLCAILFVGISEHMHVKMPPMDFIVKNKIKDPTVVKQLPKPPPFGFFFTFPSFLIALLISFCYCLLIDTNNREAKLTERENAQLKSELTFLRSQISPHFMFNVLNSLVSLTRKKSDLLEPSLISMANLMRYMLYEREGNLVALHTEIEYLQNYINLQLLRYGDAVTLNFYVSGFSEAHTIEPMLLIPFVENAFKHGVAMIENPIIDIRLQQNSEQGNLQFTVMNNISPVKDMESKASGIGLQNIKRRLELLYPTKHTLKITAENNLYTSQLTLKLT